jgi:enoyl-[acyl-carrier protein] reductase II
MEAAIALAGQVVGRIDAVKPVAEIIRDTVAGFHATAAALQRYAAASPEGRRG